MKIFKNRSFQLTVGLLIFAACIGYIARTFHWREICHLFASARYCYFILGGSASILVFLLIRAYRWYVLLRRLDCRVPFIDVYLCSSVCVTLALFTPMRSGEMIKIEMLKRHGLLNRFDGYSSFLVERISDILIMGVFAMIALGSRFRVFFPAGKTNLAIGILLAVLIAGVFLLRRIKFGPRIKMFIGQFNVMTRNPGFMFKVLALSAGGWVMTAVGWKIALSSVAVHVSVAELLGLICLMTIVAVLSLIPGSVGVSEVGITIFLMKVGQTNVLAQTGSLAIRSFGLLALLLGVIHYVLWRLPTRRSARPSD